MDIFIKKGTKTVIKLIKCKIKEVVDARRNVDKSN